MPELSKKRLLQGQKITPFIIFSNAKKSARMARVLKDSFKDAPLTDGE
jgi:hypothetical protein